MNKETKLYYAKHTKNHSFLNMVDEMLGMGIVNPYFILQTRNEELNDISDVYDYLHENKDMDIDEYRRRVSIVETECRENIWFFFREVARIPTVGSNLYYPNSIRFELRKSNLSAIYAYKCGSNLLLKSAKKDAGKSTLLTFLILWSSLSGMIFQCGPNKYSDLGTTVENTSELFYHRICSLNGEVLPILLNENIWYPYRCENIRDLIEPYVGSKTTISALINTRYPKDKQSIEEFIIGFQHMRNYAREKNQLLLEIRDDGTILNDRHSNLLASWIDTLPTISLDSFSEQGEEFINHIISGKNKENMLSIQMG